VNLTADKLLLQRLFKIFGFHAGMQLQLIYKLKHSANDFIHESCFVITFNATYETLKPVIHSDAVVVYLRNRSLQIDLCLQSEAIHTVYAKQWSYKALSLSALDISQSLSSIRSLMESRYENPLYPSLRLNLSLHGSPIKTQSRWPSSYRERDRAREEI
jgi:hypothetical protein